MKKLFGNINMTWMKVIIFAVIAGLYTGIMAALPVTKDTSFADISITFEWWVLFGIIIIVNCQKPLESGLKCFIFFLISQPLVYLVQVPFNVYGWGIFKYYPGWFVWTLCTFPMGFIGYYMRKEKWWSVLILAAMQAFVGYHYLSFLTETISFFPHHLLSTIFCAATIIIYPLFIFKEKKARLAGLIIAIVILAAATVLGLMTGKKVYNTTVLVNEGTLKVRFDDTYKVSLEDESFGKVFIVYNDDIEDYMVNAEFSKIGTTELIVESPDGEKRVFRLDVSRDTYDITEITEK